MGDLIMVSPLQPADALARLSAYGKEWRESKIPGSLRSIGIHTCRIVVENDRFRLHLNRLNREPSFVWNGRVSAANGGSRIDASWAPTRGSIISNLVSLGFIGVLWAWPAVRGGAVWLWLAPVVGMALVSGVIAFQTASASRKQRERCAIVLAHVTNAETTTAAPAA